MVSQADSERWRRMLGLDEYEHESAPLEIGRNITVYHPSEPCPYDALSQTVYKEVERELARPVKLEHAMLGRAALDIISGPPDGSRLYAATLGPMVLLPNIVHGQYGPRDFKAVCRLSWLPIVVVANSRAPFHTWEKFEEYARSRPGRVRVALTNFPSSVHSGMTYVMKKLAKLKVELVTQPSSPLNGALDTLTGETDVLISHTPDVRRFIQSGDFVPLATFNNTRLSMLPDVPTLKECGYDYSQTSWRVIVAKRDTPDGIVASISRAFQKACSTMAAKATSTERWEPLAWLGPAETQTFLDGELRFYESLSKAVGVHWTQRGVARGYLPEVGR